MTQPLDLSDTGAGFGKATRREALRALAFASAAGAPFLASLMTAGAATAQSASDYRAVVCVFMFGGNDQSNTIVPLGGPSYALYNAARPSLAIEAARLLPVQPIGYTGAPLGFSPHLPRLRSLFEAERCAVIANVGPLVVPVTRAEFEAGARPLPYQLFSHSDQQRAWETGLPDNPSSRTGWLGRVGDILHPVLNAGSPVSIAMSLAGNNLVQAGLQTEQYQLTSQGPVRVWGLDGAFGSSTAGQAIRTLMTQNRTHLFENAYTSICDRAIATEAVVGAALANAAPIPTPFDEGRLSEQAGMVARMIALRDTLGHRRQIFFIGSGGWDFHDNLLEDQAERLAELDDAIAALYEATVALGVASNVTIFTASDFGRALQYNGRGSDHGWGAHHFAVGGAVRGRRIYGTFPEVALETSDDAGQGRLIPTISVDQYAATLARWLGVSGSGLIDVVPNIDRFPEPVLGFL